MRYAACLILLIASATPLFSADVVAITDYTTYNVGSEVQVRLSAGVEASARIRYAGEEKPTSQVIAIRGTAYEPVWTIPTDARTGRYEIDVTPNGGSTIRNAGSFAVHRQLAKVEVLELDKVFYTSGDEVNPHIVVRNLSKTALDHVQVEFEAYTFPWIAPASDEPPAWKTIVAGSLALGPGESKEFHVHKAAVVQAGKEPVVIYFSVVIRDSRKPDQIYDLAFAPAAFTSPPNTPEPKAYPFLYLYPHLTDVPKSEAYRNFYPPEFVSDQIIFVTSHTMFGTETGPEFSFTVKLDAVSLESRVLDSAGKELRSEPLGGAVTGAHHLSLRPFPPGLYTLEVLAKAAHGEVIARNRLEFAVNHLPKSILIFCAHDDDDTAHPGIIRAATENHIAIHFVYFTGSDGGGCDRFYMHSCDSARAMDFGEVRMNESRASLKHLGVTSDNISFLGLPDGGMEQIWYDHIKATDPYHSVLLASEHAPYRNAAVPNLPFAREPAIDAAKYFIAQYQPDLIITGHPDERHVDHRVNNWIVVKAMKELLDEGKIQASTKLQVDVVYGAAPGIHAPYRYEETRLYVSGEAARVGQEALWYYQTQDGNHQQANLIDFTKLPREEPYPHFQILDWADHQGWNEHRRNQ